MYSNILITVALDHESMIPAKLDLARHLLAPGGRMTVLTVLEAIPGYVSEFVTVKTENNLTDAVKSKLMDAIGDAEDVTAEVTVGKPGVVICEFAGDRGCDMIIVGSHRPGIQDYFLGSTASRVVRRADCSVVVVRD